ncbi:MAG: hypothetical protein CM15mP93_06150 [Thiotrichaceae bacterium]|jgi:DNA-binding protein Fis|nr:Fis family transcriptional regulator [Gammaproteobacteria bacterium]MEC8421528.1 helix-turn-helix domain-containing protein [Pseudomonadota bacterium]MEC9190550.1 helix-turn-helix domain-containing protein [Pseudomonadota bacterium]GIR92428.1 MAG: hypothetical protein CM15mP93_06150 [Thiotrichaceae bacterium]|tara:strand:- start:4373 stop:4624 length:252 start_codon:yes stop_codon:yes gene_type:complete
MSNNNNKNKEILEKIVKNYFLKIKDYKNSKSYYFILSEIDQIIISEALKICKGNQLKASELLGINRGTLRSKLSKYKITFKKK